MSIVESRPLSTTIPTSFIPRFTDHCHAQLIVNRRLIVSTGCYKCSASVQKRGDFTVINWVLLCGENMVKTVRCSHIFSKFHWTLQNKSHTTHVMNHWLHSIKVSADIKLFVAYWVKVTLFNLLAILDSFISSAFGRGILTTSVTRKLNATGIDAHDKKCM